MTTKRRNTTFWSPSDLKADADFPSQSSIAVGTTYIDCANLSLEALRVIFGESTAELYDICTLPYTLVEGGEAGKINAWARYKSGEITYDDELPALCTTNPTFTFTTLSSNTYIGDFAGYNHSEDTRPTYWGSPHQSEQYIVYNTTEIRGGLQRGKLCPILPYLIVDPEEEYYWDYVKVQVWRSVNSGAYSLVSTIGYIDLDNPTGDDATLLYVLGDNSEVIGNDYSLCFRPVYMDTDGTTPLAVCEGGVEVITYRMWGEQEDIEDAFSVTLNDIQSYDLGDGYINMRLSWDFDVNNLMTNAADCYVRLRVTGESFTWNYIVGYDTHFNSESSVNFTEDDPGVEIGETIADYGVCSVDVQVSFDTGSTWITIGNLGTDIPCYSNI